MSKKGIDKKELAAVPPIDNYSSRQEWETVCWQKIIGSKELLQLLITSHERHDIVMRAAAINSLSLGKSYNQIGEELWLSPQTISGIKKSVSERSYRSYLERSKKERKKKVYSSSIKTRRPRPSGIPRRTKYGTLYM